MPSLVNGERNNRRRPDESAASILPPVDELHGVNMPGGALHRAATEDDAGFMAASHVRRLREAEEAIAKRPVLSADMFAPAAHKHVPELVPHDHPDLLKRVKALEEELGQLQSRVSFLERRPVLQAEDFAPADHTHAPHPLPPHDHPHEHDLVDPKTGDPGLMSAEDKRKIDGADAAIRDVVGHMQRLAEEVAFVRRIAEEKPDAKREHGTLIGGRLHESVSNKLAGFMTPEQKRMLDTLWADRTAGGTVTPIAPPPGSPPDPA